MKKFENIYNDINKKFHEYSRIDVSKGSVIDMILKSMSYMLSEAHIQIEENKKPYLFTKQEGKDLDNTGYFLQCNRLPNETDENYRSRLMNWTKRNASNNITAINEAIKTLNYSSSATYVPFTNGVGTASVYIIPYKYEDEFVKSALVEAEEKLSKVISPSSIVEYLIPEPTAVKLVAYLDVKDNNDKEYIKREITYKVKEYINNIAPGDKLMLGYINNIALNVEGVEYFNIVQLYLNDKDETNFEIMQKVSTKMLYDEIIWWEVDK